MSSLFYFSMASLHTLFNWAVQNTPQPSETGDNNSNSNKFQDIPKEWIDAILASDADKMSKLIKVTYSICRFALHFNVMI